MFTTETGRQFGSLTSPAKTAAARRNGARGGRPRKRRGGYYLSAQTVEWATPPELFRLLDGEFGFTLDACATPDNAKCPRFFTRADNALAQPWACERVFMNPPYDAVGAWMAKAGHEATAGALVVALIPARTDTRWWHRWVSSASEVRFLPGRLRFGNAKNTAPFPSAIVVFRPPAVAPVPEVGERILLTRTL